MNRSRIAWVLLAGSMACICSMGAAPDGSAIARQTAATLASTDLGDELAKVDVAHGARLTLPPGRHTGAVYQLSASFGGDHEKAISLFEWAGDDKGAGMWERRAFFNSRWNGNPSQGTLVLETGRAYLIVCHHKVGVPPLNNDQPWIQDHLARDATGDTGNALSDSVEQATAECPSTTAHFAEGAETADVDLNFLKTNNIGRALPAN